jgi:SAM-dependent methyltransferase
MKSVKEVKKTQPLNHYEKPVVISINNDFGSRKVANFTRRYRTANQYLSTYERLAKQRLEKTCITRALGGVSRDKPVLNWPCGCSRFLPLLKKLGYNVTSADLSSYAVKRIRLYAGLLGENCIDDKDDFKVVDIFQTGFDDDYFGAVIVNQLFICLPISKIRKLILKELQRICTGPIIISFFCNTIIYDEACCKERKFHKAGIKHNFHLSRKAFTEEVHECDLTVEKWVPRFGLNTRQACAVLVRDKDSLMSSNLF